MVRKDSRRPAALGGKPPRQAHPSGSRERVFRGQSGSPPSDGPGRPRLGLRRQRFRPRRPRQANRYLTSRSEPGDITSGSGELDGICRARRAAGGLRFGAWLEPAVVKALRTRPDVRRTDRHFVLRLDGRALPLVGLDPAPSPASGGGSALACHLARFPRSRRDLQSLGQQGRAALRSFDGGRRCSRLDCPGGGTQAVVGRRAGDGRPLAAFPAWFRDQLPVPPGDLAGQGTPAGLAARLADPLAALGRGSRAPRRRQSGTNFARPV